MPENLKTGDSSTKGPMILLFSPREEIRSILTAGLLQCNYQVVEADSSYTAGIKANQYLPDLVLMDITASNIRDLLFLTRLQKSIRTQKIPILVSVTGKIRDGLQSINAELGAEEGVDALRTIHTIEYPFHFAELLERIRKIVVHRDQSSGAEQVSKHSPNATTEKSLFDPQVPVDKKLRSIESVLHKQWAFPFTVIKALDIVEADSSCCKELGKCIETDLATTSAILRVSNTVYYAKRGSKTSSVPEAVVRLGFRETRNLLACLALIDLSPEQYKSYGFTRRDFWLHSLSTGIIAEKLCADSNYHRPELAFIAGLVHDIGKIPLDNNFRHVFPRLLHETTSRIGPFYETEQSMMGFTHADLGHYLASQWNFPAPITLSILNHHKPRNIMNSKRPTDRVLLESVYVANIFAKALSLGHSCDEVLEEIPAFILKDLAIPQGPGKEFFDHIYRNLKKLCEYLDLSTSDLRFTKPGRYPENVEVVVVYGAKTDFHLIAMALETSGFQVKLARGFSDNTQGKARIAIFIPDAESPLDVTLTAEDDNEKPLNPVLRIFLLDTVETSESLKDFAKSDIVLLDRNRLDLRFLLHTFDKYLEKVVVPDSMSISDIVEGTQE